MTTNSHYFHFTLGPVQSFVGQARRTRDFWAGSFLLSWLSGVAMQSVKVQGGRILFPEADKNFLDAIEGKVRGKEPGPSQGTIPNRFKAEVSENFEPSRVVHDVQHVWKKLAKKIYGKEVEKHALSETPEIWKRQVSHFWEMAWFMTSDEGDSSGLDRRKNWRTHYLPEEPGIKCSLMGEFQELSGVVGVSKKDRKKRETFWEEFRDMSPRDFSEKEHLCAISYIKRRFIYHFSDFQVKIKDTKGQERLKVHGWKLPQAVPSVAYIAAAPWFASVLDSLSESKETCENLEAFFNMGKKLAGGLSEYQTQIHCVDKACREQKYHGYKGLDGNLFHEAHLDNPRSFPDRERAEKLAGKVKSVLKKLTKTHGPISPFYAVLMMDGDSLGTQMSDIKKQEPITKGLKKFTDKVPDLVKENNGFLVYAGGDDVLALVTLEHAIPCAVAVRKHYEDCFLKDKKEGVLETSISAAIIYTHVNTPLNNVLHEAHELLDHIAKERAGRDAIAIRVYKGSGLAVEWAKKWKDALAEDGNPAQPFYLDQVQKQFQKADKEDGQFSSKFFYKIRQRFAFIYGIPDGESSGMPYQFLSSDQGVDLMAAEFLQSAENNHLTMDQAKEIIKPLMEQSRNAGAIPIISNGEKEDRITVDAALLVRFLAQKGIERGRQ